MEPTILVYISESGAIHMEATQGLHVVCIDHRPEFNVQFQAMGKGLTDEALAYIIDAEIEATQTVENAHEHVTKH